MDMKIDGEHYRHLGEKELPEMRANTNLLVILF